MERNMKKMVFGVLGLGLLIFAQSVAAEEATTTASLEPPPGIPVSETVPSPAVAEPAPAVTPVEEPVPPAENLELEFVSGEISGVDEAAQKITIKLYGETETDANDKILTISLDEATDITDGEKDRDLKSLVAGTEV